MALVDGTGAANVDIAGVLGAVAMAKPLPGIFAIGDEGEFVAMGRGNSEVFAGVAVGQDRHGSPAIGGDAIDIVRRGNVVAGIREIDVAAVRGPRAEFVLPIVEGEAEEESSGDRKHVDIAVAGVIGDECEAGAVRRKDGA